MNYFISVYISCPSLCPYFLAFMFSFLVFVCFLPASLHSSSSTFSTHISVNLLYVVSSAPDWRRITVSLPCLTVDSHPLVTSRCIFQRVAAVSRLSSGSVFTGLYRHGEEGETTWQVSSYTNVNLTLTKVPDTKVYRGRGGDVPPIINPGTRNRCVISFTLRQPPPPWGRDPLWPMDSLFNDAVCCSRTRVEW
jgi:hypothetical protein